MTGQEYRQSVYKLAKIATNRDRWGPELFKSLQRSCYAGLSHEREPCVFNILRGTMDDKDYEALDLADCCHLMPDAKEDHEYVIKMKEKNEWNKKRKTLLLEEMKLLKELMRLDDNSETQP